MFQLRPLPLPSKPAPARLLCSCAAAAIAVGAVYAPAGHAQGFQGTGNVVGGTAVGTITTPAPGQTTITINSSTNPRAIINWTPNDTATGGGAIDFLPVGNTALFQGNNNSSDFTVLNRILPQDPSRPVALNGGVLSRTSNDGGILGRGNIWFYSPGGILAGATSQFFVGGLLLSANNLTDADFLDGDNSFSFATAPGSQVAVEISAGAQLAAAGPNSYVALIAPRVQQSGTVTVNGSAAYIAGEDVDVTINGTLFNISFNTGTSVSNAVTHDGTGTTTLVDTDSFEDGYGGSFPGGARHAIMAAVPKNDAITMLVGGAIEYTPAAVAFQIDNRVVLAAGYNVSSGGIADAATSSAATNFTISNTTIDSDVFGNATGTATASASGGGALSLGGSLFLGSEQNATFTASGAGTTATIAGDVSLTVSKANSGDVGDVRFLATNGADVTVGRSVALNADVVANTNVNGTATPIVNLGSVQMLVDGASVDVGTDLGLSASATGQFATVGGGTVTAGTVSLEIGSTGTLSVGEDLFLGATAEGGRSTTGDSVFGGNATGGSISVTSAGGSLSVDGRMDVLARATGGEVGYGASPTGGTAQGGSITLNAGPGQFTVGGTTQFETIASGGFNFADAGNGGSGTGGTISVAAGTGGQLNFNGDLLLFADGNGGSSANGTGAAGTGGSVSLTTGAGGTIGVFGSQISATAIGNGGDGGTVGGAGTSGTILVNATGGTLEIGDTADGFGSLFLDTGSNGGDGTVQGGSALAGDITVSVGAGGSLSVGDRTQLSAGAIGGTTGAGTGGGGDATGGGITVTLGAGSDAVFGAGLNLVANAEGGYGGAGVGGDATGGDLMVDAAGGGIEIGDPAYGFSTAITLDANAFGGEAFGGGGDAQGGSAILRLGTIADGTVGGSTFITVSGFGGGASGTPAGDGTGGTAAFEINGPASFGGGVEIYAEGRGGSGFGSSGNGGTISFTTTGGAVTLNGDLRLDADGERGDIGTFLDGVPQGNGTGGTITLNTAGPLSTNGATVFMNAIGVGGEEFLDGDFEGGTGQGGTINANFAGGLSASQLYAEASGYGGGGMVDSAGNGLDGAAGTGGTAAVSFGGTSTLTDIFVRSYGFGGRGGLTGGTSAGDGGAGTGGTAQVNLNGSLTANGLLVEARSEGGSGGYGSSESGSTAGGSGGTGTGGSAILQVGFSGGAPTVNVSNITLSAETDGGRGEFGTDGGNGGFAQGGTARMSVAGGTVQTDFVGIYADAEGGNGGGVFDTGADGNPGSATGGNVTLELMTGASLSTFSLSMQSDGQGGFGNGGTGVGIAGDGTGGNATIRLATGSLLEVSNVLNVSAGGEGGFAPTAGSGFGGTITAEFGGSVDVGGDIRLIADGMGGGGIQAGNGTGGTVSVAVTGDVEVGSGGEGFGLLVSAAGGGGFASNEGPVTFGNGTGGSIAFTLAASGQLGSEEGVFLYADGAGYENCLFCSNFGSQGGNGTGGTIDVTLEGVIRDTAGEVDRPLVISANGFGGFGNQELGRTGQNGGDGIGGEVILKLGNGASTDANISISVEGRGGDAGFGFSGEGSCCSQAITLTDGSGPVIFASTPFTGAGGDGTGGTVTVIADGSTVTVGELDIDAEGFGGEGARGISFGTPEQRDGGNGGAGTGGSIILRAEDGGELRLLFSDLDVDGEGGRGGDGAEAGYGGGSIAGIGGDGGTGTGGSIQLSVSDSSIIFEGGLFFDANGNGGEGGFGGFNFFDDGYGGSYAGGAGGNGGAGVGGSVSIDITGGFITAPNTSESGSLLPSLELYAVGQGGDGGFGGSSQTGAAGDDGFGGNGTGGLVSLSIADLSTSGVGEFGPTIIDASGVAGFGRTDDGTDPTTFAGKVTISDTAAAPGGFTFETLGVTIGGADSDGTEFSLTSSNGPVQVLSSFFLAISGQAEFAGTGDGGLSADGNIYVEADRISLSQTGAIPGGATLVGNTVSLFSGSDIDGRTGSIIGAADVTLSANGTISLGSVVAGDDFIADTPGTITVASATTTGLGPDTDESGYGMDGSNIRLRGGGAIRLDDGTAVNLVELTSDTGSVSSDGTITAESLSVEAASDIALNDLVITNSIGLFAESGSVTGNSFTSGDNISVSASGIIDIASVTSARDVSLSADGDVSLGGGSVGGGLFASGQNVTLGDIETTGAFTGGDNGGGIQVAAVGNASIANAVSATFIDVSANNVSSGPLTAAGDVSVTGVDLSLTGAVTAGSDILVSGVNDVRLDDGTAGGTVTLASSSGAVRSAGTITANSLAVSAATDIAVNNLAINSGIAFNAAAGSITGGDFTTNGAVSLIAANAVAVDTIDAAGSVNIAADVLTADAIFGGDIIITADAVDIGVAETGGLFDLTTLQDFAFDDISAGAIAIEAASITGASLNSGSTVDLDATAGGIAVGSIDAGGTVTLQAAAGDISLGDVVARGDVLADASGTFVADTITTLAGEGGSQPPPVDAIVAEAVDPDGNGVSIAAAGDVTVGVIDSAGDVILQSANGDVLVSNDLLAAGFVDAFGQNVTLNALGSLAVRTAQATAGSVALNSGGLLSLSGAVTGSEISLVSTDIAIGSGASVGTASGTQSIFITANGGNAPVQFGGSAAGQGYTLDNAEFGRFAARDIRFDAAGSPLQIGALTVSGTNVLGGLFLISDASIDVSGRVAFANASAQNGLSIRSGGQLFVNTAGGGISVTDGNNGLTGSLELRGNSILVSTTAAASDLQNAATVAARDARLGTNDGAVNEAGVIRAGAIRLAASDRIHVQNTGAATNDGRAGLFAGAGGITLVNTNDGDVEVIINGRQTSGNQTFTGQALIARLSLQGFGEGSSLFGLADGSTVNGCLFSATACGAPPPPPPPPPPLIFRPDPMISTSVGDVIDQVEGEDSETRPPDIVFNELISIDQAVLLPIVDEPVTGTGNEDVYYGFQSQEDEEDEDGDGTIDQQVTGSGNDTLISQPGGNSPQGAPATNDEQVTGSGNDVQDGDGN